MNAPVIIVSSGVVLLLSLPPVLPVPTTGATSLHHQPLSSTLTTTSTIRSDDSTTTTVAASENNNAGWTGDKSDAERTPNDFATTPLFKDVSTQAPGKETRALQEDDGNADETRGGEGTPPPPPPQGDVNTEEPDTGIESSATEHNEIVLVDGRVPTIHGQLVKCQCGAKEVLTKDGCQHYPGDTFINAQNKMFDIKEVPVASLDVVVHEPDCKTEDGHREMNFTGEEFYLRQRGDLVLKESVGLLEGLRINNYCVSHYMDDGGHVTWGMKKACIPPPSVPRCCPPGEAMEGGVCRPAPSPTLLTPPISADMFKGSTSWPVINNHIYTLNCTKDPMKTLPLDPKISVLMSVPTGMVHMWIPSVSYITRKFTYPNDFCVDAHETSSGSVEYSANICFTDPLEKHHKVCDGNTCVRKCCDHGEVMSSSLYRCIALENSTFSPPFIAKPSSFKTVIGTPPCRRHVAVSNFTLDARGHIYTGGTWYSPAEYCTDKFSDGKTKLEQGVLVCLAKLSEWDKARDIAFPVCQVISVVFLALTVLCYCLVPVLLQRGGWYHFFYVLSLMLAYSSGFLQQQFGQTWDDPTCIAMAVVMQFGYLCTFFWLNVLCFEVWRKIKSLSNFLPAFNMPLWVYLLYACGGPSLICTVTLCMQFFAPDDVVGLVKPHLAESRCWFPGTIETLAYFFGPIAFLLACNMAFIAHTFCIYKTLERNMSTSKDLRATGPGLEATTALRVAEHSHRKRDGVADFKQQFSLLVLMSTCWVTEILSWKIPPPEMWALTDIFNSLQGFFVFVIFIANRRKRKLLKMKFPKIFALAKKVTSAFSKSRRHNKESTPSIKSSSSSLSSLVANPSFHLTSVKKDEANVTPSSLPIIDEP